MKGQGKSKCKVFVGLSGGVDSSVSAALLKEQGYNVTGVFIKVWTPDFIECTWKEDRLDAMRVCAKLGIPFVTLDLSKEYKKEVVDYMIAEYKAGKTPNPDVMCNRYVKFGGFYKFARESGSDYVATGHYARIVKSRKCKVKSKKAHSESLSLCTCHFSLLSGSDPQKDQSYFLWTLTQEQLAHTLFPVGDLEKPAVRKLAKKFDLPTADKKDSQGLCFLGKIDVKEFLKHFIKSKRGKVLLAPSSVDGNENGEIIGTHDGAMFFTFGERRGFEITQKTPVEKPYYVVGKNVAKNTLTVSNNPLQKSDNSSRQVFELKDVNWISGVPPVAKKLSARIRYRQPLQRVRIMKGEFRKANKEKGKRKEGFVVRNSKFVIRFASAQIGGDAGQSIVVYDGEVCLGGGTIL